MAPNYPQPMQQPQTFPQQQSLPPPQQQQQPNANAYAPNNTGPNPQQPNANPYPNASHNHDPTEKHIYYGPNGEVIPGPPTGLNPNGPADFNQPPDDFAIEGVLQYGKLAQMSLIEAQRGFPKLPDFLIRDLVDKYGHIERMIVRIVMRGGQAFVHADMGTHVQENKRYQPEYVSVVLDEDEEFDYDKFYDNYQTQRYRGRSYGNRELPPRQYRTPPPIPRSFPLHARDTQRSPDIRPDTYDPTAHLRWKKKPDRSSIVTAPVFPPPSGRERPIDRESYRDRNSDRDSRNRDRDRDRARNSRDSNYNF